MTLQDITGYESGAVQYSDGSIWIGNWSVVHGIPRELAGGIIGLGDLTEEDYEYEPAGMQKGILEAMLEHERAQGDTPSWADVYRAIYLPRHDVTVVTCEAWASPERARGR